MQEPEEFRYDLMVDQALRGVVKQILSRVAEEGLFGEHHYYITFQTNHPGVALPESQRKAHPDNITVVLQHRPSGIMEMQPHHVTARRHILGMVVTPRLMGQLDLRTAPQWCLPNGDQRARS